MEGEATLAGLLLHGDVAGFFYSVLDLFFVFLLRCLQSDHTPLQQ